MPPRFPPSVYLHKLHTVAVAVAAAGDYPLARDQCVARYLEGKIKCARLLSALMPLRTSNVLLALTGV
jgi:hypothetical protein